MSSKFLVHLDPDKPLRLECDASPVGIGAVLSHRVHGVYYPIGFRSRTLSKAERNYSQLDPGLDIDIERLVKTCCTCAQVSALPPAQKPLGWPDTGERWSRLHADFAGPIDGQMVSVVVDAETKWIEAVVMKVATSQSTIDELRSMFARFGLPKKFVSDNRPQFVSGVFGEFLARNSVRHLTTARYHPQSNALAERAVRKLKELKKNPGWTWKHEYVVFCSDITEHLSRMSSRLRSAYWGIR